LYEPVCSKPKNILTDCVFAYGNTNLCPSILILSTLRRFVLYSSFINYSYASYGTSVPHFGRPQERNLSDKRDWLNLREETTCKCGHCRTIGRC